MLPGLGFGLAHSLAQEGMQTPEALAAVRMGEREL